MNILYVLLKPFMYSGSRELGQRNKWTVVKSNSHFLFDLLLAVLQVSALSHVYILLLI